MGGKKGNIMKTITMRELPKNAKSISSDEVGLNFSGKKTARLFAPWGHVQSLRKLVRELEIEAGEYGNLVIREGRETLITDLMAEAGVIFVSPSDGDE